MINFILDIEVDNFKGNLSKKKYMNIVDTTSERASRDLSELIELECIKQKEGIAGRNVHYIINS